jgi:MATE family multidrug resistance protein
MEHENAAAGRRGSSAAFGRQRSRTSYNVGMFRRETTAMVSLAWPVVLAEIGWVLMGIVDTVIVGPLGPAAIGAVGTGSTIFFAFIVLGIGTLFALDTFVAQHFGAGRIDECHRWLFAGFWLAAVMSVLLIALGLVVAAMLPLVGMHPDVLAILQPYLRALLWSVPPLLVYTVLRRYLQAMGTVRPITVAVVLANVINAGANVWFVYGGFGWSGLGVVGSAYATLAARIVMAAIVLGVVLHRERARPSGLHDVAWAPDWTRMWRLVRLGVPAAGQLSLEVGVFAAASALAARISPGAVAANQIVLNVASFFFMVPLGLSSAAAVRVGQAIGRGDVAAARLAGWSAMGLTTVAALASSVLFIAAPTLLLGLFTDDPTVIAVGTTLMLVYAVFLPFDGLQSVATGALRGTGDTRTPMLCNLAGHWFVGLPLGYVLCFWRGWGVLGLWVGLSFGLLLVGAALGWTWHRATRVARVGPIAVGRRGTETT